MQAPSSPVPSSPSLSFPPLHRSSTSKLPRFLHDEAARNRSKSVMDPVLGAGVPAIHSEEDRRIHVEWLEEFDYARVVPSQHQEAPTEIDFQSR
ncbi:hypothetical protein D9613_010216 [Agrocybe pediades]|uniref:Uncharacterized protein n=1 Tax=Agrocybe pediades TaxID=84607 RepID=A0A8H4QGU2_9AGAR|nr:hypothetical protein D9613_010216 [Agrocybe pediades]